MNKKEITKLAKLWCAMNRFEVPPELKKKNDGRDLTKEQIWGAMILIQFLVKKKDLLEEWNK